MPLPLDRYNDRVKNWTKAAETGMKQAGRQQGITHRRNSPSPKDSLAALTGRIGRDRAFVVNRVTFSFSRSLVFTHMGAGKGMAGRKGTSWVNKQGVRVKTDPESLGKAGTGSRQRKPWYNECIESPQGIEALADIAAEEIGDSITAKMLPDGR